VQDRKKSFASMPLAGVSGAKGTRICRSKVTSSGVRHTPSGSSAKAHVPFNDHQASRSSCGRG
jgi:hypothetical protein